MGNKLMNAYKQCQKLPFGMGNWAFSKAVSYKAPYFRTIKPMFHTFKPGFVMVTIKNKWGVQNHLKSVHAGAMCNLAELTAGSMLEATLPTTMRWLPKGMDVEYLKMAKTGLTATCKITTEKLHFEQELPMVVNVTDANCMEVFRAKVNMHITEKPKKG
jgi:acyl-coenzyme A thioesterase PaaI-like protein